MTREDCEKIIVLKEAYEQTRQEFMKAVAVKNYQKGEHLFWDKEEIHSFCFLLSGYVSLYKLDGQGEKKVIFICAAGEMLNEVIIQDSQASINAEALADCTAAVIDKEKMRKLLSEDFVLAEAMMNSMAVKIRRLYRQMKNTPNAVRLDKQIAARIWKLSRDYGRETEAGIEIDFDISISLLAEMVGAKRETVSRQLKILVSKNLIIQKKKRFLIPDNEKLIKYMKEM